MKGAIRATKRCFGCSIMLIFFARCSQFCWNSPSGGNPSLFLHFYSSFIYLLRCKLFVRIPFFKIYIGTRWVVKTLLFHNYFIIIASFTQVHIFCSVLKWVYLYSQASWLRSRGNIYKFVFLIYATLVHWFCFALFAWFVCN